MRLVQLNKGGIKILPNYYKQIEDLHYSYGNYDGHEADLVNLSHVMLNCFERRCKNKRIFLGTRGQESFGQLCEE